MQAPMTAKAKCGCCAYCVGFDCLSFYGHQTAVIDCVGFPTPVG